MRDSRCVDCSIRLSGDAPGRWTKEQADAWAKDRGWLVGCNFLPSTAVNSLEMFQADSFDPATIDRELGWAESLGFNSVRIFLNSLLWQQDDKGFLGRLEEFLAIAEKHHIGAVFVLFDSCWDPEPKLGKQPDPIPRVHNSRWVQSPGSWAFKDPAKREELKYYVLGVVGHFRDDRRVQAWDIWNEPEQDDSGPNVKNPMNKEEKLKLVILTLEKAFAWARQAKPSQPLTSGLLGGPWKDRKSSVPCSGCKWKTPTSSVFTATSRLPREIVRRKPPSAGPADPLHRIHGADHGKHVRPDPRDTSTNSASAPTMRLWSKAKSKPSFPGIR